MSENAWKRGCFWIDSGFAAEELIRNSICASKFDDQKIIHENYKMRGYIVQKKQTYPSIIQLPS